MYERIDARELAEWMAYYQLEPWGSIWDDMSRGVIAATIANVNRTKETKAFTPDAFRLLKPHEEPKAQTVAEQLNIAKAIVMFGGAERK